MPTGRQAVAQNEQVLSDPPTITNCRVALQTILDNLFGSSGVALQKQAPAESQQRKRCVRATELMVLRLVQEGYPLLKQDLAFV